MSAAAVVLAQVWATACDQEVAAGGRIGPASIHLVYPVVELPAPIVERPRTGRLHLVQAGAKAAVQPAPDVEEERQPAPPPTMAFYRQYTEGLLQRYMRFAMSGGRTPSLLGRELFRGKVANCAVRSFDDVVIFVADVEKCIGRLSAHQQSLIQRIALQGYTHVEAARLLRLTRSTAVRLYGEALDELTTMFISGKLVIPFESCQEGE
jgi:hypothetical protein